MNETFIYWNLFIQKILILKKCENFIQKKIANYYNFLFKKTLIFYFNIVLGKYIKNKETYHILSGSLVKFDSSKNSLV